MMFLISRHICLLPNCHGVRGIKHWVVTITLFCIKFLYYFPITAYSVVFYSLNFVLSLDWSVYPRMFIETLILFTTLNITLYHVGALRTGKELRPEFWWLGFGGLTKGRDFIKAWSCLCNYPDAPFCHFLSQFYFRNVIFRKPKIYKPLFVDRLCSEAFVIHVFMAVCVYHLLKSRITARNTAGGKMTHLAAYCNFPLSLEPLFCTTSHFNFARLIFHTLIILFIFVQFNTVFLFQW